jgi:hypothetical protein
MAPTTEKIFVLFVLLMFVGAFCATNSVHASPATLDGLGTFSSCGFFVNDIRTCSAQSLSTTHGHDIIILSVVDSLCCSNTTISSIIDSSGLTFTPHISYTPNAKIWEYFARGTSPLNSDNITVVFSSPLDSGWFGIQVFAIHGANTRAIFDQNPSIPATCTVPACGICDTNFGTCSVTMQTSTFDFVIASVAIGDAPPCGGETGQGAHVPPGFTTATFTGKMQVDYAITTTLESNVVFDCAATDVIAIVLDAISLNSAFGT